MRMRNKIAGALGASAVVAASMVAITAPAANAVAVNGGCSSFFRPGTLAPNTDLEHTGTVTYLGQAKGAWSDEANTNVKPDYTLTSTGGTETGQTRNFTLTYDKGMLSFAPATGTQHWFFSVNGVMLPVITQSGITLAGGVVSPGGTVTGSYEIDTVGSNVIKLEKMVFDANEGVRVVCSGAEGNTATSNPHATPVATNVQASFTAIGPEIALGDVEFAGTEITGSQAHDNYGRAGDIINFTTTTFASTATGTVELCDTDGVSNCEGTGTVEGNGAGSLTIPAGATAGARKLVATVGSQSARADFNVLGQAQIALSQDAGGVGTTVTVSGNNFDPGQVVTVRGVTNDAPPTGNPSNSADAAVTVTASATGTISAQAYTVNDADTRGIMATQLHRVPNVAGLPFPQIGAIMGANAPYMTATSDWAQFTASANSCTAKYGTAATGECAVVQTLTLNVTAGDLTMAQTSGDIAMSGVQLDGTAKTSTGAINDIVVKDYRNGTLGWSLNAKFSGMSGAGDIDASALSLVAPDCAAAANNTNTLTTAAAGAFADENTAITLCAVDPADLDVANGETSSGDTTASSDLELAIASDTAPGNYTGTLTFTLS